MKKRLFFSLFLTTIGSTAFSQNSNLITLSASADNNPIIEHISNLSKKLEGSKLLCGINNNDFVMYKIDAEPGVIEYTWLLPPGMSMLTNRGSNQIYVEIDETFSGGTLSVIGKTNFGETAPTSIYVDIIPEEPEFVIYEKNIDEDKAYEFAVADIEGVKFIWKTPESAYITKGQGFANVKIKFGNNFNGGNIEVYAENSCGAGLVSRIFINGNK
jgi:hypothetical protein